MPWLDAAPQAPLPAVARAYRRGRCPSRLHGNLWGVGGELAVRYPCVVGELGEFSLPIRLFLRVYRWRRIEPVPWVPLEKPMARCHLALVSSAGFVLPRQEAFDAGVRGGDVTFREIPSDVDVADLRSTHRSQSFDHAGLTRDPNLAFPIDRVRELAQAGRIGAVTRRHLSFMGAITAPGRLVRDTAPEMARLLVEDGADVALLVPV